MINTRIGISLLSILAALAIVGGTTFAYFTDTATSSNNTFASGSVDINIKNTSTPLDVPFNVTAMAPGDTVEGYLVITNDGTEDVKWRGYITNGDGGQLFGALRIKELIIRPDDFDDYDELSAYTIAGPENTNLISSPIPFSDLLDPNSTPLTWDKDGVTTLDAFKPGWAGVYKVVVEMDPDAGDSYEDTTWSGDMTFFATQETNAGW